MATSKRRLCFLLDGLVDRRLKAGQVDNEVRVGDLGHLPRAQLKIVGLGSGLDQIGHGDAVAADPLGHELQWVEASHDPQLVSGSIAR